MGTMAKVLITLVLSLSHHGLCAGQAPADTLGAALGVSGLTLGEDPSTVSLLGIDLSAQILKWELRSSQKRDRGTIDVLTVSDQRLEFDADSDELLTFSLQNAAFVCEESSEDAVLTKKQFVDIVTELLAATGAQLVPDEDDRIEFSEYDDSHQGPVWAIQMWGTYRGIQRWDGLNVMVCGISGKALSYTCVPSRGPSQYVENVQADRAQCIVLKFLRAHGALAPVVNSCELGIVGDEKDLGRPGRPHVDLCTPRYMWVVSVAYSDSYVRAAVRGLGLDRALGTPPPNRTLVYVDIETGEILTRSGSRFYRGK